MQEKQQKRCNKPKVFDKEYLITEYHIKRRSFTSLCYELKTANGTLSKWFKIFGISKKSQSESRTQTLDKRFERIQQKYPFISKQFFESEYIEKEKSLPDLSKEFNLKYNHTLFLLDYYNLPKRSISESTKTKTFKQKKRKTYKLKYGEDIENISQATAVKKKKQNKCLTTLGVDNFFKQKNIKNIIEKGFQLKYGCSKSEYISKKNKEIWALKTPEEKAAWLEKSIQSDSVQTRVVGYRSSRGEAIISEILTDLQITHTRQLLLKYEENGKKRKFFYDIYIPKLNLIIEFNGDYWHANPLIYKASDLIHYRFGNITAADIWNKDNKKKMLAESKNYNIITIWESEIKNSSNNAIKNLIQNKIYEITKD